MASLMSMQKLGVIATAVLEQLERMGELKSCILAGALLSAAAYWIVRRYKVPLAVASRLGMGLVALYSR